MAYLRKEASSNHQFESNPLLTAGQLQIENLPLELKE